jgi:N-dimethylarginine dimethylaminohydrolase
MVAPLRRVMVRHPAPPARDDDAVALGYPRPVDHERTLAEHRAFCAILEHAGVDVIVAGPDEPGQLDAIFTYDPSLMTDAGAVLLRPGKAPRLPGAGEKRVRATRHSRDWTDRDSWHSRGWRHSLARRADTGGRPRLSHQ